MLRAASTTAVLTMRSAATTPSKWTLTAVEFQDCVFRVEG